MGKGDKRSRRGKIFAGSYGKTRPRKKVKKAVNAENKTENNEQ
jgi:30S ribosomal protein S31